MHAWNVDGSSDDKKSNSWIKFWEDKTGEKRGICAQEDCKNYSMVGGHIWIKANEVFIAPICKSCNNKQNMKRLQHNDGNHSIIPKGIQVVKINLTDSMKYANRFIAERDRKCENCDENIHDSPVHYQLCKDCWNRRCENCIENFCDSPDHALCKDCWNRRCENCGENICNRPDDHLLCKDCWNRRCKNCGENICNRPDDHLLCQDCWKLLQQQQQLAIIGLRP